MRNDVHAPSRLVPADYRHLLSFAYADGFVPGVGLAELRALRADPARRFFQKPSGKGGCDVCGAHYKHGDVFVHEPTGEHVVVGWECAGKIDSGLDHSGAMMELARQKKEAEQRRWREQKEAEARQFLADRPGLEQALGLDHRISKDLREKLFQWGSLSEKQVNLAHRLAADAARPQKPKAEVPQVEGRVVVSGQVLSVKTNDFGQPKMLVEVDTPEGAFRLWGSVPRALVGTGLVGQPVSFRASVKRSDRDPSFGFFSRPAVLG